MSKHNAMILCEHKKVTCPTCDAIFKQVKAIIKDIDTAHGKLTKISKLVGEVYYG